MFQCFICSCAPAFQDGRVLFMQPFPDRMGILPYGVSLVQNGIKSKEPKPQFTRLRFSGCSHFDGGPSADFPVRILDCIEQLRAADADCRNHPGRQRRVRVGFPVFPHAGFVPQHRVHVEHLFMAVFLNDVLVPAAGVFIQPVHHIAEFQRPFLQHLRVGFVESGHGSVRVHPVSAHQPVKILNLSLQRRIYLQPVVLVQALSLEGNDVILPPG